MNEAEQTFVMTEERDPVELAKAHAQMQRYERNWAWLEAHAAEAYSHRGKMICIAGQELFVGDTTAEVFAWAKGTHPEDDGVLTKYVPVDRGPRIYGH
jgi:hypothetical protein